MWTKKADGSIEDAAGKVIFFSTQRFVDDICLGQCCFVCGARTGSKPFNDEHILPAWLLRRFNLFARTITLPGGHKVRYDRYTVPCCQDCNSLMGEMIETPISTIVSGGASAIYRFLEGGDLFKLYVWMGLIYLKTHLKDRAMRMHLDHRKGDEKIADDYDWSHLHHIHASCDASRTVAQSSRRRLARFCACRSIPPAPSTSSTSPISTWRRRCCCGSMTLRCFACSMTPAARSVVSTRGWTA